MKLYPIFLLNIFVNNLEWNVGNWQEEILYCENKKVKIQPRINLIHVKEKMQQTLVEQIQFSVAQVHVNIPRIM